MLSTPELPVYGTQADLEPWIPGDAWGELEPWQVDSRILAASILVREATLNAYYQANPATGLPVAPSVLRGFRAAVGVQVAHWLAAGVDDPLAAGLGPERVRVVASLSGGGRSVSYQAEDPAVVAGRLASTSRLCDSARLVLRSNGLISYRTGYQP